eukprot:768409-Hanusia_phi.AAC.1
MWHMARGRGGGDDHNNVNTHVNDDDETCHGSFHCFESSSTTRLEMIIGRSRTRSYSTRNIPDPTHLLPVHPC